ncbi:MAG: hypothetical protein S4CHLAM102_04820 [Chlamydiia bacterium]|nr:hypothetical protein [Chlamydiia bacterium]
MAEGSLWCSMSFGKLIQNYQKIQSRVSDMVRRVASNMSTATPGRFLLLQFAMSQVTQVGDSISNLLGQVNSVIANTVRNQKTQ